MIFEVTNIARARAPACWAAAFLLAAPAGSVAQTEFHYQYGKLGNPFSRARHFTHILTVQQASSSDGTSARR